MSASTFEDPSEEDLVVNDKLLSQFKDQKEFAEFYLKKQAELPLNARFNFQTHPNEINRIVELNKHAQTPLSSFFKSQNYLDLVEEAKAKALKEATTIFLGPGCEKYQREYREDIVKTVEQAYDPAPPYLKK